MFNTHDAVASAARPAREINADVRRSNSLHARMEDYDLQRHPAIPTSNTAIKETLVRTVFVMSILMLVGSFLAACGTVYEHRDGGGYTVRYAAISAPVESPAEYKPKPKPKPKNYATHKPTIVIVEGNKHNGESHPVLNVGKDSEIPTEYAKYVSDRGIKTIRARGHMCRTSRPGYCNSPNIPHCHGSFCHAHPSGDKRHTH